MKTQIIFYNGKWYSQSARPDFLDMEFFAYIHALHYASSAFEGARCYPNLGKKDGSVNLVGIDWRVERFFRSMEYAWLKIPPRADRDWENFSKSRPELAEKYAEAFKGKLHRKNVAEFPYNKMQVKDFILNTIVLNLHSGFIDPAVGCYVRPVAMRGISAAKGLGVFSLGHRVDFLVVVKPWGKYLGDFAFEKGTPLIVASEGTEEYNRQYKLAANYLTGQRLVNYASYNHFIEILLTDNSEQRNVLEGSGENLIFYCGNNEFVSPSQEGRPILPGTTLKVVDRMIRAWGGKLTYRDIPLNEVLGGKFLGAAMTGTAAEVTPVALIFEPKSKKVVEIPVPQEIKAIQKNYLNLVQGLTVEETLKNLQKELLLELKWDAGLHDGLLNSWVR